MCPTKFTVGTVTPVGSFPTTRPPALPRPYAHAMLAAVARSSSADDPLSGLHVGEHPEPEPQPGWVRVQVRAATLNHHDLWTLRGVATPPENLPIVLGTDAAGVTEGGAEVVVHAVIGDPAAGRGDETLDPEQSLLSERYDGTLAEYVWVPERNLVAKPAELSFEEAACVPTAWLTAFRMLFTKAGVGPGDTVLVQGAGGGVATAAVVLGSAAGVRMWVTGRQAGKRARAEELGAEATFEPGARLPDRVDAVIETVGKATWAHSLRCLRPGGRLVVAGATTGSDPQAELRRVFRKQLEILGSTMGTREELEGVLALMASEGLKPVVDSTFPLARSTEALERLATQDVFGKIAIVPDARP